MAEPKFAYDYEFHFSTGEPCYATLTEDEHKSRLYTSADTVRMVLHDKDGAPEGEYEVRTAHLNWRKWVRRPVEDAN